MDFARATITQDIFIPRPTQFGLKSQLKKQAKHNTFYKFQEGFSFAEHRKLVAESSEFHLTLKRAHLYSAFFPTRNTPKKRDILSEKRESGMALKSVSLRPKAVLLTPMYQGHGAAHEGI